MNIVFLTSPTAHHYYLINEVHKSFPVKKVFLQTKWEKKRTWNERFRRWRRIENIIRTAKGVIGHWLFQREAALEARYEREMFFNGTELALDPGIPSAKVHSFNEPQTVTAVRQEDPDLIIVFGTEILKGGILNIAKNRILNIHRGIAPQYCGGSVDTWAFYHNDFDHLGVTIHVCTDDLDAGDIVGQKFYRLQKDDHMYTLRYKTTLVALDILKEVLDQFKSHSVRFVKQSQPNVWKTKDLTFAKKILARRNLGEYLKKLKK